jgi:hypothetical protein
MATRRQIAALARKLGAEVSFNAPLDIDAVAPRGFVFRASGCHSLVASAEDGADREVRRLMYDDLLLGIEACEDPTCEHCEEVR